MLQNRQAKSVESHGRTEHRALKSLLVEFATSAEAIASESQKARAARPVRVGPGAASVTTHRPPGQTAHFVRTLRAPETDLPKHSSSYGRRRSGLIALPAAESAINVSRCAARVCARFGLITQ